MRDRQFTDPMSVSIFYCARAMATGKADSSQKLKLTDLFRAVGREVPANGSLCPEPLNSFRIDDLIRFGHAAMFVRGHRAPQCWINLYFRTLLRKVSTFSP
jgi:hypothetical protein